MFNKIFRLIFPAEDTLAIKRKYHIPDKVDLNVRIKTDGWIIVTSPDLPGLITQAHNPEELLDMFNDAILTYYDVPKRVSDVVFNKLDIEGVGTISYAHQRKKVLVTN